MRVRGYAYTAQCGHSFSYTVDRPSSFKSLLLTVERAAPTAEMNGKKIWFDQKWGGHGRPSRYGSDAPVLLHPIIPVLACFNLYAYS